MSATDNAEMYEAAKRENKKMYPAAAERSKDPILQALKKILAGVSADKKYSLLEISSGTGQHMAYFAPHFPSITFQPSEYDVDVFESINKLAEECPTNNIKKPIFIDASKDLSDFGVEVESLDFIYNSNMVQVSPYECAISLFKNAGKYLKPKGKMITYGPYGMNGVITPESNFNFDKYLKSQNPHWGIRDLHELKLLAEENKVHLKEIIDMPANNKCVVWEKEE